LHGQVPAKQVIDSSEHSIPLSLRHITHIVRLCLHSRLSHVTRTSKYVHVTWLYYGAIGMTRDPYLTFGWTAFGLSTAEALSQHTS